jgi:hypothetical protein
MENGEDADTNIWVKFSNTKKASHPQAETYLLYPIYGQTSENALHKLNVLLKVKFVDT